MRDIYAPGRGCNRKTVDELDGVKAGDFGRQAKVIIMLFTLMDS
jgi:hypothetical protein